MPAIYLIQALLILAGYLVSKPPELQLVNKVLLGLYSIYIALSLIAVGVFACRRRA